MPETPHQRRLQQLDRLSYLLDDSIRIPVIGYRIGYDAILGLIPGIGDAAGLVISSYIVVQAARLGAPRSTLVRMGFNVAIEALVGVVPVLGDIFDAAWKANNRNMRLLHARLDGDAARHARIDRRYLYGAMVVLALATLILGAIVVLGITSLLKLLGA